MPSRFDENAYSVRLFMPYGDPDGLRVIEPAGTFYRFTRDYDLSSPSTAAGVLLGRTANGRVEWKDAGGKTLKEIQEAEAEQLPA